MAAAGTDTGSYLGSGDKHNRYAASPQAVVARCLNDWVKRGGIAEDDVERCAQTILDSLDHVAGLVVVQRSA